MMDASVLDQGFDGELWPEPRLAALAELADREDLDAWIDDLRRAETSVRWFRKRLEALRDGRAPGRCPVCGGVVAGRADAVYCGDGCRLRAYRGRARPSGRDGELDEGR
jgi:hypothetical protein